MEAFVEILGDAQRTRTSLAGERVSVGASTANDIVLADPAVSHVHAVLELVAGSWFVRDMDSRNGTAVNGERILTARALRDRDEIRVGGTSLVFRSDAPAPQRATLATTEPPPPITPRERDVLRALCRPVLSASLLTEASSVRAIAEELVLTPSAVKKHLQRLYDKFDLHDDRRTRSVLANEAIARGAVSLGDL